MKTRPPSSSCTSAATAPKGTAPLGVSGRGGWTVMTPIISTPHFQLDSDLNESPSTVVVLYQRGHGPERDRAAGSERKGRLDSHDAHHLHPPFSVGFRSE